MRDIYVFKKRISLCFGKVVGGGKKKKYAKGICGLSITAEKNRLEKHLSSLVQGELVLTGSGKDSMAFPNLSKPGFLLYSAHKH